MGEARVLGLKLSKNDADLINSIDACSLSNSELLRESLVLYFSMVNQNHKEKNKKKVNQNKRSVNQRLTKNNIINLEKNQKKEHIDERIVSLEEENEWLKNRVEFYEDLIEKLMKNKKIAPPLPNTKNKYGNVRF